MKFSIYLAAFLPWGVLAPLNVIKLMLNAVSPTAHFWVPKETEQCQGACGIARMWAQLFWSLQFISALSFVCTCTTTVSRQASSTWASLPSWWSGCSCSRRT